MKTNLTLLLTVGIVAAGIAAGVALNHKPAPAPIKTQDLAVRTFQVNGRVRSLDLSAKTVTVAHQEIPGYMPAMTMPLQARDGKLLTGLRSGDEIHFELSVTEDDSWISHVEKIGGGAMSSTDQSTSVQSAAPGESTTTELENGESVPDFALTDQNGKPVHLRDFRGKAVVLTFIYTRCPLPNFCPLMSKNFQSLQDRLAKALPGKFQLFSVTIDPKFDTPEVLKNYAALYRADEKAWSFATGSDEEINAVTSLFGLVHEPEGGMIAHNLRTALIGADGRLVHLWKSNVWTPYEVQRRMEESALGARVYSQAR